MGSCKVRTGSGNPNGKGAEDSASVELHRKEKEGVSMGNGQVLCRCSVRAVHEIISRFDEKKREIVEAIGFGGLLKFPRIKSTNRRFSAWLMGMVDAASSSLNLPDGHSLKFYSEDVYIVFGVPDKGKQVSDARMINKELREKLKLQCWPNDGKEKQSIKAVEELLNTDYKGAMTKDEEDAFKIAFVVFVMSTLFVPGAKHDYVHVDYWGALSDPDCIHMYDWSAYVHKKLLASAAKFKADITKGSRHPNITGCYLFLQIFYLDNMDLKGASTDHSARPRVSCFTQDTLNRMIAADTPEGVDVKTACSYGISKVKPQDESCYTWAQSHMNNSGDEQMNLQLALWRAAITMARILRIPMEAAGPLFMAAAGFNQQKHVSRPHYGIECLNVLLTIMEPFVNGFSYNFDLHQNHMGMQHIEGVSELAIELREFCTRRVENSSDTGCSCRKRSYSISTYSTDASSSTQMQGEASNIHVPTQSKCSKRGRVTSKSIQGVEGKQEPLSIEGVDYEVIKSMSRFYYLLRCIREHNRLDLNVSVPASELLISTDPVEVNVQNSSRSPWDIGTNWGSETQGLNNIAHLSPTRSSWSANTMEKIVDFVPKYIEVMPERLRDQRIGLAELEMDMYDAVIRSFRRSDDELYRQEGRLRWRHFFESDVVGTINAGIFDIDNPTMRNQFLGSHLKYDVYNCSMLFFPVILQYRWVCFAWKLKDNAIIVFDPGCNNTSMIGTTSVHRQVAYLLKSVMSSVMPHLFPGWQHEWSAATVCAFQWRYKGMQCSNRTGVLCAYFSRCFDGEKLRPEIEEKQLDNISELIFTTVSELYGGT